VFVPDPKGFLIFLVYGHVEFLRRQFQDLRHELPRVLFTRNPETLLAGYGSRVRSSLESQENVFKGDHARVHKEKGRIAFGDKGCALYPGVSLPFEEAEEKLPYLVGA